MTTSNALNIWGQLSPVPARDASQDLQSHIPAWRLRMDGVVVAANPTALWMWGARSLDGEKVDHLVIGQSVFTVIARNLHRIPVRENHTFFAATFRIEYHTLGNDPASPLVEARKRVAELQHLYERTDKTSLTDVWDFMLKIQDPREPGGDHLLTFKASVQPIASATGKPAGYLTRYQPYGEARTILNEVSIAFHRQADAQSQASLSGKMSQGNRPVDLFERRSAEVAATEIEQSSTDRAEADKADAHWREFLGPVLSEEDVRRRLGLADARRVAMLRDAKHLLAVHANDGRVIYPAFQFMVGGKPYPTISSVLRIFGEVFEEEENVEFMTASWLQTPQVELEGETPLHWLEQGRDPERVEEAARVTADRFAH